MLSKTDIKSLEIELSVLDRAIYDHKKHLLPCSEDINGENEKIYQTIDLIESGIHGFKRALSTIGYGVTPDNHIYHY